MTAGERTRKSLDDARKEAMEVCGELQTLLERRRLPEDGELLDLVEAYAEQLRGCALGLDALAVRLAGELDRHAGEVGVEPRRLGWCRALLGLPAHTDECGGELQETPTGLIRCVECGAEVPR